MKTSFFPALFVLSAAAAHAQTCTWDVHPLNTIPCPEWIYPAPGCGGCGSCRMAIDSDESIMDAGLLYWSENLVMCPHPIDTMGNNVVVVTGYPMEAHTGTFLRGRVDYHQPVRIDALELECATSNGGPDSVDIALSFNTLSLSQTVTVHRTGITTQLATYTVADLGCAPMVGGSGYMNIYIRAHGGDQGFLFKGLRVVASPCSMVSVPEMAAGSISILPWHEGVNITTKEPVEVSITDALGRVTRYRHTAAGTTFVPLEDGLNIVRAGDVVQRIVR